MKHPFAGVVAPIPSSDSQTVEPAVSTPTRRGLFRLMAGVLAVGTAGTVGLVGSVSEAEATVFFGEGGRRRRPQRPTTLALGEEGRGPVTRARFEQGRRRRMKK